MRFVLNYNKINYASEINFSLTVLPFLLLLQLQHTMTAVLPYIFIGPCH